MGMAKFISHLDLLRCFERAILRSGLPVEYSQGFNPHQKMTFALPLPVGVTSECEAVDIFFEDGKATDTEICEKLNQNLPPDIRVIKTGDVCHKAADIVRAEYIIVLKGNSEIDEQWIKDFFANDEIVVMKKTKKKTEKPINIIEYIRAWEIVGKSMTTITIKLVLDAGGERNIKPDVVIGELCKENPYVSADDADIHRCKVFCKADGDLGRIEVFE